MTRHKGLTGQARATKNIISENLAIAFLHKTTDYRWLTLAAHRPVAIMGMVRQSKSGVERNKTKYFRLRLSYKVS